MEEDFDETTHGRLPDRRGPARRALRDGGLRHTGRLGARDGAHRSGRAAQQILDEEKAADEKLTTLAEGGINQDAAAQAHSGENDEKEAPPARSRPSARQRSSGGKKK